MNGQERETPLTFMGKFRSLARSMLLVFMLAVTMAVAGQTEAYAAGGSWNGVTWDYTNGTLTVSGGSMPDVGQTAYPWYSYVKDATTIRVNVNGHIGNSAFYNCRNASTIDIGANVSSIGSEAFYNWGYNQATNLYVRRNGNVSLGNLALRKSTTSNNGYVHCQPNNISVSNRDTYSYTSYLSIYHDLGTTGTWYAWDGIQWRFDGTTGGGTVYVQTRSGGDGTMDATTSANGYPWYQLIQNSKVINVNISAANVGQNAFYGINGSGSIVVNVSGAVSTGAFQDCKSIKSITVNASSIGNSAFYNCRNASTIDIGANVSSIGSEAFYNWGYNQATNLYVRRNGNVSLGNLALRKSTTSNNGYVHCQPNNISVSNKNN